jgi:hypothetical protein
MLEIANALLDIYFPPPLFLVSFRTTVSPTLGQTLRDSVSAMMDFTIVVINVFLTLAKTAWSSMEFPVFALRDSSWIQLLINVLFVTVLARQFREIHVSAHLHFSPQALAVSHVQLIAYTTQLPGNARAFQDLHWLIISAQIYLLARKALNGMLSLLPVSV